MWRRRSTLARLYQELGTIKAFDRVHEFATTSDPAGEYAYALRQIRRSQITAEIQKLTAEPGYKKWIRISSGVVAFCAVGYATLHFLLR